MLTLRAKTAYAHVYESQIVQDVAASVEIRLLNARAAPPFYASAGAAGLDLIACLDAPYALYPGETALIGTGLALNIMTRALVAKLYPRSSLGLKGLVLANGVGIIDSDYQGEVKVALWNRNDVRYGEKLTIEPGARIAQMLFEPVARAEFKLVEQFAHTTARGAGGFGSTGK